MMKPVLNLIWLFLFVIFTGTVIAKPEEKALTFRNSGLYGGWNEYFIRKDIPFDFLIVQCKIEKDSASWHGKGEKGSSWNDWLIRAEGNGKKVVACLYPVVEKDGQSIMFHRAYKFKNRPTVEEFADLIDAQLSRLDLSKLYAITLGEENVYWNGQHELLVQLYDYMKAHYDIPVYQWYSPGAGVPGMGWPNLKADGWIIDDYNLDQQQFEYQVSGYAIRHLPILSIIWAGPDMKDVPYSERRFWEQYTVCRKYNVPTSYFNWTGQSNIWGWSENPPIASKRVFDLCKYSSRLARETPAGCMDLDFVPIKPKTIELSCHDDGKAFAGYTENFNRNRGVTFLDDARITGFANFRWDSSPLQLWASKLGKQAASLIYQVHSPFPLTGIQFAMQGKTRGELKGNIQILIRNAKGQIVTTFPLEGHTITKSISVNKTVDRDFELEIKFTGQADKRGQIPAELSEFTLTGELLLPKTKQIVLEPDDLGNIKYTDNLDSLSVLHTAEIKNREQLITIPGALQAAGMKGRKNRIEAIQNFISVKPIKLLNISVSGRADKSNLGSTFETGISLDGKTMLKNIRSSGSGEQILTIDFADIEELSNVKKFYIHLGLSVNCGVKTKAASHIMEYTIVAETVK